MKNKKFVTKPFTFRKKCGKNLKTMFKLSENWLTEGWMDAEYKQYLLLAYLKDIHEIFSNKILYPPFAELIEHHRNLLKIKQNLQKIKDADKELISIDWKNMNLIYGKNKEEKTDEDVLEEIIEFSIPKMEEEILHGKNVFDDIEQHLKYTTVGLMPLNKDFGYFFVQDYPSSDFLVYKYELSSIYQTENTQAIPYKRLKTEYISTYTLSLSNSLTSIKREIIKQNPDIPNPAVYSFFPNQTASLEYTVLPIVKRVLLKLVA